MRKVVLTSIAVAAVGLLAAGCGGHNRHAATAAKRPTLPRIHEGFTVLPCPPTPSTTVAMEGCAEHRILRTDAGIERRARAIFAFLRPKARGSFTSAERAWLAYRKAVCTVESFKYEGGSAEPLVFADCVASQNARHLTELASLERYLRSA